MAGSAVTAARPLVNGRVGAAGEIATALGCAATLLSSSASVRWAGGAGGGLLLIVADQATPVEPHADGLRRALLDVGVGPGDAVAIERGSLTLDVAAGLGNRRCPSAGQRLAAARARKHKDEIELIERAAEAAMQELAGAPVDAGVDLMTGSRTAMVGAPPTARRLEPGDPVLFDLSPQRHGYWADSCATFACAGAVSAPVRRRHDAIRQALERGLREARVGTTAGAVDAAIRAELERHGLECPHHTGHGVGAAQQESPWLVPGEPTVIDEGMVLAIEPGSYADGFGVRLEHLALIEAAGARPLTTHALDP